MAAKAVSAQAALAKEDCFSAPGQTDPLAKQPASTPLASSAQAAQPGSPGTSRSLSFGAGIFRMEQVDLESSSTSSESDDEQNARSSAQAAPAHSANEEYMLPDFDVPSDTHSEAVDDEEERSEDEEEHFLRGGGTILGISSAEAKEEDSSSDSSDSCTTGTVELLLTPAKWHTAQAARTDTSPTDTRTISALMVRELGPKQFERMQQLEAQLSGLEAAKKGLTESGNPLAVQTVELEITKLNRIRRGIIRKTQSVARAFLTNRRRAESEAMKRKRKRNTELVALQNKIQTARRPVDALNKLVEEEHTIKRSTAEFLGKGQINLGGTECSKRRQDLLQRIVKLGVLDPEQCANFNWFKVVWDHRCKDLHGDKWPELLLCKLKAVLDKLYTDPTAFSRFMFYEEREVFGCTNPLLVPNPIQHFNPYALR